jgi:hypothetical protein
MLPHLRDVASSMYGIHRVRRTMNGERCVDPFPETSDCSDERTNSPFIVRRPDVSGVCSRVRKGARCGSSPGWPGCAARHIGEPLLAAFSRRFGLEYEEGCWVPPDFGCMEIGWYLNHSDTPNAYHDGSYEYFAGRNIAAGEEITIDYRTL